MPRQAEEVARLDMEVRIMETQSEKAGSPFSQEVPQLLQRHLELVSMAVRCPGR